MFTSIFYFFYPNWKNIVAVWTFWATFSGIIGKLIEIFQFLRDYFDDINFRKKVLLKKFGKTILAHW